MQQSRRFWFLLDIYAWLVLGMSIVAAIVIQQWWMVLLGIIGYLISLLTGLAGGRALGQTGAMRLARAEQENRELKAEQARLLGAIRELEATHSDTPKPAKIMDEINPPTSQSQSNG